MSYVCTLAFRTSGSLGVKYRHLLNIAVCLELYMNFYFLILLSILPYFYIIGHKLYGPTPQTQFSGLKCRVAEN